MVYRRVSIGLILSVLISGSLLVLQFRAAPVAAAKVRSATADPASHLHLDAAYGKLPLSFEVNHGQTDAQVKFLSRGSGRTLFLTSDQVVLAVTTTRGRGDRAKWRHGDTGTQGHGDARTRRRGHARRCGH